MLSSGRKDLVAGDRGLFLYVRGSRNRSSVWKYTVDFFSTEMVDTMYALMMPRRLRELIPRKETTD